MLIPGGGVRTAGSLPSWVTCRLDRAIERYAGEYLIALSAGTVHRPPPLDQNRFPILESVAAARYLLNAGIPADRILTETCSLDTIGNAFFSRVIHADPREFRRLLVITSDFHLERTRMAFEWVYRLSPVGRAYEIRFEGVCDDRMDPAIRREREEKERNGRAALVKAAAGMTTLAEFHRWLFTQHGAYTSGNGNPAGQPLERNLLESY